MCSAETVMNSCDSLSGHISRLTIVNWQTDCFTVGLGFFGVANVVWVGYMPLINYM